MVFLTLDYFSSVETWHVRVFHAAEDSLHKCQHIDNTDDSCSNDWLSVTRLLSQPRKLHDPSRVSEASLQTDRKNHNIGNGSGQK